MAGGSDHRNVDPAPAPEVPGQTAAQEVEHVEAGHQLQIAHGRPQGGHISPGQHQTETGLRPRDHNQGHDQAEGQQQLLPPAEALPPPVLLSGPGVLAGKDGHCRRAAVPEGVGEALDPDGGGKGDDGVLPQGIYRPLDQQLADVQIAHVQGGDKAEPGGPLQQGDVHHHVRAVEHQLREPGAQVAHAQRRRQGLGQDGGQRGPRHPHGQPSHQSQVQHQVDAHRQGQEEQGGLGVAHRPQHPGGQMVGEGGGKAQKDDVQILTGISGHGVRGLEQGQQGGQKQQSQPGEYHRGPGAEQAGQVEVPAEGLAVPRSVKLGQQGPHAVAAPADEEEEQIHHRARHPHRPKGGVPYKAAHDHRVHRVVELLQDIPRQQRDRQGNELGADIAVGELCHRCSLLSFRPSITAQSPLVKYCFIGYYIT